MPAPGCSTLTGGGVALRAASQGRQVSARGVGHARGSLVALRRASVRALRPEERGLSCGTLPPSFRGSCSRWNLFTGPWGGRGASWEQAWGPQLSALTASPAAPLALLPSPGTSAAAAPRDWASPRGSLQWGRGLSGLVCRLGRCQTGRPLGANSPGPNLDQLRAEVGREERCAGCSPSEHSD